MPDELRLRGVMDAGLPIFFEQQQDPEAIYTAAYHYYPPLAKVRAWMDQAGLTIEAEGAGSGFHHCLARKGTGQDER